MPVHRPGSIRPRPLTAVLAVLLAVAFLKDSRGR